MNVRIPYLLRCMLMLMMTSSGSDLIGQSYLLIEKSGNPRTTRMKLYDEITFQLKDDQKIWYTRQILGLNADAQLIQVGDTWLPLADVSRIRLKRQRAWANIFGGALQGGGASMFLGDAWYTVVKDHRYTEGGMEFGLLNMALGTGIRSLFGPIKYRLGDRHRLRVVDLTF